MYLSMSLGKNATALKGLKDLRARIVSQERERTRSRLPGSHAEEPAAENPPVIALETPVETPTPAKEAFGSAPAPAPAPSPVSPPPSPPEAFSHPTSKRSLTTDPGTEGQALEKAPFAAGGPSEPPRWRSLLTSHCEARGWSEETLLTILVEESLRARQPAIRAGSELLASADRFRSLACPPGSPQAVLRSDQGCFHLQPKPTSPRMSLWRRHYELMGHLPSDAKQAARRRTLLELLEQLRSARDFRVGAWFKQVSPDDFNVVRQPNP